MAHNGSSSDPWLEAANLHATVAQLLSTVIHQVNNALQTIGGHAELLKTDPGVTDTTLRRANTITGVTDRTAELLASFQVFTRPSPDPERQNLKDVASRALAFRHYGFGRARIQAAVQGVDTAFVVAEARPLMQAVLNVVLNAEQALAAAQRGGCITIDVAVSGDRAALAVVDDGPGLPADREETVTGSGAAGGGPRRDRHPGPANRLGLGLQTARAIAERMGGTCAVSAVPSGGTRVELSFPAAAENDEAVRPA